MQKFEQGSEQLYRVCVTGGPCAGKTTSLQNISTELTDRGFKVIQVPEAATLMMKGGCFIQTNKMSFVQAVKF
jgi:tRNA uridine 5-carbamoylmethylation protein Kti12